MVEAGLLLSYLVGDVSELVARSFEIRITHIFNYRCSLKGFWGFGGYCINDVRSTKEIFNRSKSQIKLRQELTKKYDINLFSSSEPKISKELFAYYLSQKLNIEKRNIKSMRTYRDVIRVKDIILPYISFKSETFKSLLNRFKSLELNPDG